MAEKHKPYERSNTWESLPYKALGAAVDTKFQEMKAMGGGDVTTLSTEEVADFQTRNEELKAMRAKFAGLREASEEFQKQVDEHKSFTTVNPTVPHAGAAGDPSNPTGEFKSLSDRFVESPSYKKAQEGWSSGVNTLGQELPGVSIKALQDMALKTTMATTAGWAPYPTLSPRAPVMTPQIQPVVADLIPQDDTDQPIIIYYEETVFTNNADFVAEGGPKPEAALALERRDQPVCKVAVLLPITDEQLMDVPQVRSYVDGRLQLMVRQKEQVGLLRGNGVAPQLQGFHTKPNIGSLARAAGEDNADVFLRAITEVNSVTGLANATGVIMNPLQWLAIRLVRTTTGDYIWGHPSIQGPTTLWGLPVISTNAETDGLGLVGDFQMYSHISRRLSMRIDVGYINEDFKDNIQRIRLEERLSLEIYRAKAFCEVTNLNKAP
jgi:HK97 family phage major capsid protein